ncbi:MAG: M20 family metallo-hydrolase [Calditrichaeota bacterium]|nr:M20 family metallo-hydrolase [Calditrichota bacterium]HQU72434.1 M20 family metallo-hydrolase [Calditrichia bacterium]
MNEMHWQTLSGWLVRSEPDMIDFQTRMTAIPALGPDNDGEGEWDRTMWVKAYLEEKGLENIEQYDAPDERAKNGVRPNLIVTLPGQDESRTIWLMAHLDVVPTGDLHLWDSDPWQVVVRDGKLFGRGTEDNQQGVTSSLFTLLAFRETGIKPAHRLGLILVADEECGSRYGLGYLLENHRDLFHEDDLIIVPDAGNHEGNMIEVAEKSILWLRLQTTGLQCHASTPSEGVNAFRAGANLAVRLQELYERFDAQDPVFEPPLSTFEPTRKEANVPNINTIPGEDVFYLDCRVLPNYPLSAVVEEVRRIAAGVEADFGVKVKISTVQAAEAAPPTPVSAEVVQRLKKAIAGVRGLEAQAMGIGGGTVAALFREAGLPAAVWSTLDDMCHQPNEYCRIDNMVNDARVFAYFSLIG